MGVASISLDFAHRMVASVPLYPDYASQWWTVQPKVGNPVPFRFNAIQRIAWHEIDKQRRAKKPIRQKHLKFRQGGDSTFCCGLMQYATQTNIGWYSLSIADKKDLPRQWIRRARQWEVELPLPLRHHLKAASDLELYFDRINSRYYIDSEGGTTPGMGYTIRGLHCSEVAKWMHPGDILDDLMEAVPWHPETIVIFESTGEMVGDYWYGSWWASHRGEDDYAAVFLPWFVHEEYRAPADDILELTSRERDLFQIAAQWVKDHPDHAAIANFDGLTNEHIAWRRVKLPGEPFYGDQDAFACKYPATPEEAFLAGGRAVFSQEEIAKARATIREPLWRGEILPRPNPAEFQLLASDGGGLLVWDHDPRKGQLPDPKWHYAIGADCQWGVSDLADYDAAYVERIETGEVCARLWGRWDMAVWAATLASLGHYYKSVDGPATLAPERNTAAGIGVIRPLLGLSVANWSYPNVWIRNRTKRYGVLAPEDYGWYTDKHTKMELMLDAHELLASPRGMDFVDDGAVEEMAMFVRNRKGDFTAPEGSHDDRIMARMITAKVAHSCLAELASRPMSEAWGDLTDHQKRVLEHIERVDEVERQRERGEY